MTRLCPRKLYYILNSGKNSKLIYYIDSYLHILAPRFILRALRKYDLHAWQHRSDKAQIMRRVAYYNKLDDPKAIDHELFKLESVALKDQEMTGQKVYYLDSYRYARSFPQSLRWLLMPGDVVDVPPVPTIVKSRPIVADNANSVLMKLNHVRHFLFVKDRKSFREKKNRAIFRGLLGQVNSTNIKQSRYEFVQRFFGNPLCNVGVIDNEYPEWHSEKLTIEEHLDYKFIMALEGNDVASNLKWIMSSNSIAVMPRPTCETWFMEKLLQPNVHYIEIAPDYSDFEERIHYYIDHPDEAEQIISNAHDWVDQFRNRKRERIISNLVLQKYFDVCNK